MSWKTKGMNQDLSVSAFNPEFAFENINLRLATNEGNTMLSWVNEKGTLALPILAEHSEYWSAEGQDNVYIDPESEDWTHHPANSDSTTILGIPIGTAIINHKLVVFTTGYEVASAVDHIYVLYFNSDKSKLICKTLFSGNLNFSVNNPIETLVSYESEGIQKVYWVDGRNQPRLININNEPFTGGIDITTRYDFVSTISLGSSITVATRIETEGVFVSGVIQYCFTYVNKHSQQSNIIDVTPLYYTSPSNRGGDKNELNSNSFTIFINHPDPNFDYVRIYSIFRSSLNGEVEVKLLEDIPTAEADNNLIIYTDRGDTGIPIDPSELLYIGGREIIALTMADKDGTLFLGNIKESNSDVSLIQDYFDFARNSNNVQDHINIIYDNGEHEYTITSKTKLITSPVGLLYHNDFGLNSSLRHSTTFKGGQTYRFGFQLQKRTGEWSEPIFIDDKKNELYPRSPLYRSNSSSVNTFINLVYAKTTFDLNNFIKEQINNQDNPYYIKDFESIYKRIRPVIVYPEFSDREVLCQGVLNPTVFNSIDRIDKTPYAQASWFFRPYSKEEAEDNINKKNITIDYHTNSYSYPDSYYPFNTSYEEVYVIEGKIKKDEYYFNDYPGLNIDLVEYISTPNGIAHDNFFGYYPIKGIVIIDDNVTVDDDPAYHLAIFVTEALPRSSNPNANPFPSIPPVKDRVNFTHEGRNYTPNYPNFYPYNDCISSYNPSSLPKKFKLYNNLRKDRSQIIYYERPDNNVNYPDKYIFDYIIDYDYVGGYRYYTEITFKSVRPYTNLKGCPLQFTHYHKLVYDRVGDPYIYYRTGVEVQGSNQGPYDTPFSLDKIPETSSVKVQHNNMQFFVDQSIVTLNSPDIEFNKELQAYPLDNLKLRIVGAIPITSGASYHKIVAGTLPLIGGSRYGEGELPYNTLYTNIYEDSVRLVSDYLWNDSWINDEWHPSDYNFLIYPWQKEGSLNNDLRSKDQNPYSWLETKKISNILYSYNTEYFKSNYVRMYKDMELSSIGTLISLDPLPYWDFEGKNSVSAKLHLAENEDVHIIKLPKQSETGNVSEINYEPNIDKVLYNTDGYPIHTSMFSSYDSHYCNKSVHMRYKSGSHIVIAFKEDTVDHKVPILPCSTRNDYIGRYRNDIENINDANSGHTFWGDVLHFKQGGIQTSELFNKNSMSPGRPHDFLWLGELYRDLNSDNLFGGKSKNAILSNKWLVCGDTIDLPSQDNPNDNNSRKVTLRWVEGDTYYQRYDCLKTYPFSSEDTNQIVEILSFMCESYVNLDGRYDNNRGKQDNTLMTPNNFNLLNDVYSQKNNFFVGRKLNKEAFNKDYYPNLIVYSKTKESGSDVDLWTNITLASNLELDGDKGQITSLRRFNDQLIAFQDKGISQILYNENVQISTEAGVPIEIANSGKVQGKRYISNTVGCSNKWSIVNTPSGIYFIDSYNKDIYLFNGQLQNVTLTKGFNAWAKNNIPSNDVLWNPVDFDNFIACYDTFNQEVLFIDKIQCLAFSEKLGVFTSFYNYEDTPYLCNLDDNQIWIKANGTLWKHQAGDYCKFFGENKSYSMTLIGNPEPQTDKIFTNLEFRANSEGEGTVSNGKFTPTTPFDSIESWDEYQHGFISFDSTTLKRKFRTWACNIPRDNVPSTDNQGSSDTLYTKDSALHITRFSPKAIDRMRNHWLYLKLKKNAATGVNSLKKTEIHDIVMTYFN